jgi:hypothetical protein
MWLPRPSQLHDTVGAIRKINEGGGPRRLRLVRVGRPKGLLPSSETTVEVKTASGKVARRLALPLASTLDPEDLSFELPVPRWAWPG